MTLYGYLTKAHTRLNKCIENPTIAQMILFYSEYCNHCRMLLDTIKRHDSKSLIKLVCVESLVRSGRKVPAQIHSVPAMILENKSMMFGKQVFDYLLLPGRGILLTQSASSQATNGVSEQSSDGPSAYSLGSAHSDQFSMIEGEGMDGLFDRSYVWTTITDKHVSLNPMENMPLQEETRSKKELPDINTIREQRQNELQMESHLNISALPPPTSTRV